jgi:hypothetical protein
MDDPRWDAVLPSLGLHYNSFQKGIQPYREAVGALLGLMRNASRRAPRKLLSILSSPPQHFSESRSGEFRHMSVSPCADAKSILADPLHASHNRWRDAIVWRLLTGKRFAERLLPWDDAFASAAEAAEQDTCSGGGIGIIDIWAPLVKRSDVHPGRRCTLPFLAQLEKGLPCKWTSDCTHHCWGPLPGQMLWGRLHMAAHYHVHSCETLHAPLR